jgi:hypothetical protein
MSLFRGALRPPAILSDEAVERYLAAIRAELAPDPLFRRRLRGEVMNRYVAVREGTGATRQRRSMGKLGRAVLYASFTLAMSATSVLAVSQEALPGDLLYPLKRQIESLRIEVLPAHLHHDLAAYELAERIDELARLTELGDWPRVASLAAVVAADYEAFLEEADAAGLVSDDRYFTVLTALLERLPEPAQDAVQAIIDRSPTQGVGASTGGGSSGSVNSAKGNATGGSGGDAPLEPSENGNGPTEPDEPQPTPKPTKSPKPAPEPTPRASRGQTPADTDAPGGGGQQGSNPDADDLDADEDQGDH